MCSTPVILKVIRDNLASTSPNLTNWIKLLELHLPELFGSPSHLHLNKLIHPDLVQGLMRALDLSAPSFAGLLETLRSNLLIYDMHAVRACSDPVSQCAIPFVHFNILGDV
jgi:hypothetical protein